MTEQKKSEQKNDFDFTQDTQKQIFATLFECDPHYESRILKLLEPIYFTNPTVQTLFEIFKEFFNKYDRVPSIDEFLERLKQFCETNKRLKKDDYDIYFDEAYKIIKISRKEPLDFAYDQVIKFCKYMAYQKALLNAAEKRISKLDVKGLEDDLQKIQEIGIDFEDDVGFQLIPLSEIEAEEISWLWYHVIPKGKLTFLVGDPDVGKSFLSLFIASRISSGKPLPHTPKDLINIKGTVLLLNAEDTPSDTIKPRIENTNGDTTKISILKGTRAKDGIRMFSFVDDLPRLEEILKKRRDIKLVIIDPITAYMTKVDYFKDTDVRSKVLAPLATLASDYNTAVILIAHMNKDEAKKAIYRLGGSIGLLGGARCAWCVIKDTSDKNGEWRKFACLKMNIARKPTRAMYFRIYELELDNPTLEFSEDLVECNIETELSGKQRPVDLATDFLKEFLKHGKRATKEVFESARANNHSQRTVVRASEILMVKKYQKDGSWWWEMPERKGTNIVVKKNDNE